MQNIILTTPYRFIPPHPSEFWSWLLGFYLKRYLNKTYGITHLEIKDVHYLQESLEAGHGILLAPNHSRPSDPMVLGSLVGATGRATYTMASRHLFSESGVQRWLLTRIGAFSINRETADREALKAAIAFLAEARRPLVIFPEGVVTRANDRLAPLQDGVAFIARSAARMRAKESPPGKVVMHPLALRYKFLGDATAAIKSVLHDLETRFGWRHFDEMPLRERICKMGEAMLTLKELEYYGRVSEGPITERIDKLIEHLMRPLEKEWIIVHPDEPLNERAKRIRQAIVPDLVSGGISNDEKVRRWRQLADVYLAIQLSCYPPHYLDGDPPVERLIETVERFEEDLTDVARTLRPFHVGIRIGPPIEVAPSRERRDGKDPLTQELESHMRRMLFEEQA